VTHEDSKPDSSCQPKSLVVRVSDSNRGSEPVEDGGQIKDSEHFHTVSRYGELFLYNRNLAMTQRIDQGFDDRSVEGSERALLLMAELDQFRPSDLASA